jgi:hypothetical protein
MSSYETPQIKRIEHYKKYWEDAVIVMVSPFENVFYAQGIQEQNRRPKTALKS